METKPLQETKRWLLNQRKISLHQRITNRGIMAFTHHMILYGMERAKQMDYTREHVGIINHNRRFLKRFRQRE